MKKASKKVAAVVVHPETGKEFDVTHQIDVQGWIDAGYKVKGQKAPEKVKTEPIKTEPAKTETGEKDETKKVETETLTDEQFLESVKDKLQDLNAADAKRVADHMKVKYTNKRDTMALVEDMLAKEGEDL